MTQRADLDRNKAGGNDATGQPATPLYRQVRDRLVARLAEGVWRPGQIIPSEFQIADDLGVSQGTVRKALDVMTAERLLTRQQGRGTFVAEIDDAHILFHFFNLAPDRGPAAFPTSRILTVGEGAATAAERERLAIGAGARVVRIRRLRALGGDTAIFETISLPLDLFPGLAALDLPNNLYGLYSGSFGVRIAKAQERLKAVALPARAAKLLNVAPGHPSLCIDRIARDLDHRAVEWRVSLCLTERLHYLSDLQ